MGEDSRDRRVVDRQSSSKINERRREPERERRERRMRRERAKHLNYIWKSLWGKGNLIPGLESSG